MVNYARMESVYRAYGPLEPITAVPPKPRRTGRIIAVAGLAVVAVGGAAAGAYLRPDFSFHIPELSAAQAEAPRIAAAPRRAPVQPPALLAEASPAPLLTAAGGALPADTIPPSAAVTAAPVIAAASPAVAAAVATPTPVRAHTALSAPAAPKPAPPAARVEPPAERLVVASRPEVVTPAAPLPRVREAPSFDCGGARSAAQEMVCASPALVALDRQMAAELAATLSAGHDSGRMQLDQDRWLATREAAAPDPRAVADAYRRRIRQLRAMR